MEFNRELLFFFSALGAFNGLVLSLYFLLFAKPRHISSKFLGAFLLMMSIRIGKSVFFYFNNDLALEYLQFGLTACILIGPFLYFYVKSVVQPESKTIKTWRYHVGLWLTLALVVGYLYPFKTNVELWRPHFIMTIYYQWFLYTIATGYILRDVFIKFFRKNKKLESTDIWLTSIFIGNLMVWAAFTFSRFSSYILGALTFSFLFYLLFLFLFFNKKKRSIIFQNVPKYVDRKIEAAQATLLMEKLERIMLEQEPYKNPNLKSSNLAKQLNISTHQFSQLLNDSIGKSFPVFINEYRIEEAKRMLKNNENLTLEAIGYECGFNSKSTFYTAFKKEAGTTPALFQKNNS